MKNEEWYWNERFNIDEFHSRLEHEEKMVVLFEQHRPSMLMKPKVFPDGNQYCALYGANLQEGVAGFGDTPAEAMKAFDLAWQKGEKNSPPSPTKESV